MIIKPLFRASSFLFGIFFIAALSVVAVSGPDNLTEEPNHMAAQPIKYKESQAPTPNSQLQQTQSNGPTIDIWYGSSQYFGFLGDPQPMINILGNVSDPDGISSLEYRLNGGAWNDLSWKESASAGDFKSPSPGGLTDGITSGNGSPVGTPSVFQSINGASTNPRLVSEGDFNIEIDVNDLNNGQNTVTIRATDNTAQQNTTLESVIANYTSGETWPLPYTADWSSGLSDVAQVVDGEWAVISGRLRPLAVGYDRVVAIGELTAWDDFEVRVPVTIHNLPFQDSGGVGIVARWQGHFVQNNEQPGTGWWHLGAYAYYRNRVSGPHYAFRTSNEEPIEVPVTLNLGATYIFKLRVQTKDVPCNTGARAFYSFRVWEASKQEPSTWIFEECDDPSNTFSKGSVLLVAHNIDASFGDVSILPVLEVNTTTNGSGSVNVSPPLSGQSDAYLYGDQITLTATPSNGWLFDGWSGDLIGSNNPETLTLTGDSTITANFIFAQVCSLVVSVVGGGTVSKEPDQPYICGQEVELTAIPNNDWTFTAWTGDVNSTSNPETLTLDTDKVVSANFAEGAYVINTTQTGSGIVTVEPDQTTYAYGQNVTISAIPDGGWRFLSWGGDLSGTQSPFALTVTDHLNIVSHFGDRNNDIFVPYITSNSD